jgi:hypothetical protein
MSREENLAKMREWSKVNPPAYHVDEYVHGCTGKNRHPSVQAAERSIKILDDSTLEVYNCKNLWRLARRPPS